MGTVVVLLLVGFGGLAIGTLLGRYYVPDDRAVRRTARHARAYMRAINHLLARDKDAAVAEITRVVEENVADVEPYFALGALFRGRGEWERAIRVHQAIEMREDGNKRVRVRALYELGLDFRAAGMPRRATKAMESVIEDDPKHEGAVRALCGLYEEQARYADAADAWRRLAKLRDEDTSPRELHLWSAATRRAIATGELDDAKRHLRRAQKLGANEPHVLVAAAEYAAGRGNPSGAIAPLHKALVARPELAAYIVPAMEAAVRQHVVAEVDARVRAAAGNDGNDGEGGEGRDTTADADALERRIADETYAVLDDVLNDSLHPDPHLLLAHGKVRSRFDLEGAFDEVGLVVEHRPELISAWVARARLVLALGGAERAQRELAALSAGDGPLAWANEGVWRCTYCHNEAPAFFWRCERCRQWGKASFEVTRPGTAPPLPPRERRVVPRGGASLVSPQSAQLVLPPADDDFDDDPVNPSLVGRAGSWLADRWAGMRGRKRARQLPPPTEPTRNTGSERDAGNERDNR